uniref:Uncharacterized protein n=1 Tax=Polytomella parva TaxID=51329 RepID=A0A7S0URG3_9CHLO|mmetsp:Transcript_1830/g.2666  ORF Transcript_1830/g.2666 Transcript_1830/m.2666 type:complete len:291 (+) Transcript_1830:66-938(+)|eukprot:CAMPEP_0175066686 /NCGR_PEP_ID=MMETSP0052_2-20121109/16656_1 /TAXON_ID=51329 ORGANISM="Polytomella parva, Strain SAG 63-3" /NCGR_SAMPLE_ID=MMETSP0052_2 /ASSEMBLY_ACC=CAM_ASM_000194 /LENGTH=290 /DNA_ID=CAMNT_0016333435 /DNA_START=13 /DNA_END=885 /DNA_ORIENTATION=+
MSGPTGIPNANKRSATLMLAGPEQCNLLAVRKNAKILKKHVETVMNSVATLNQINWDEVLKVYESIDVSMSLLRDSIRPWAYSVVLTPANIPNGNLGEMCMVQLSSQVPPQVKEGMDIQKESFLRNLRIPHISVAAGGQLGGGASAVSSGIGPAAVGTPVLDDHGTDLLKAACNKYNECLDKLFSRGGVLCEYPGGSNGAEPSRSRVAKLKVSTDQKIKKAQAALGATSTTATGAGSSLGPSGAGIKRPLNFGGEGGSAKDTPTSEGAKQLEELRIALLGNVAKTPKFSF